ncbi:MAG: hypothetical protein HZC45_03170 [Deltaproteobacteria bacterium]|nr:hypothetical protein [Deltaproteobacteria bacterium]
MRISLKRLDSHFRGNDKLFSFRTFARASSVFLFLITVSIIFLFLNNPACSADVAVLADMSIKPMAEAVTGIEEVTGVDVFDLKKERIERKYKVIVALGTEALKDVKGLADRDTYIVYSFVANPFDIGPVPNSTGVTLFAQFEKSLKTMTAINPSVKRLGVVYNPASSTYMLQELKYSALKLGLQLNVQSAQTPSDAIKKIQGIEKNIDAFMLIPDATLYTSQVVDYILLSGFRNRVPVIGFTGWHIKKGALMSYTFDTTYLGRQIGRLVADVLVGKKTSFLYPPDYLTLEINLNTMEFLNIVPPKDIMDSARGYRP